MNFLDILVVFRLDLDQISFNLVKNTFATPQLTFLATSIAFYHIVTWACAKYCLEWFNPLTPGAFAKMNFLDILVVFRLDLDQISFNLVKNTFATPQLTFLATSIAFYHIMTWACVKSKFFKVFGREGDLRL